MPSRYLRTSDIAKAVGVHPNTVRLYEAWGFLPPIPRSRSGYRLYTETHLDLMRLAWTALKWPFPGGKALVIELVKKAGAGNLGGALERAYVYLARVRAEQAQAEAAIQFLERWAQGNVTDVSVTPLSIGQVAHWLEVTRDQLRNWERNGLLDVPRDVHSGYRVYGAAEIGRMRVIRMLRQTGYSMMAILRMLLVFDRGQTENLRHTLDTPRPDEDVYSVADRWLSTLATQERRALEVIDQLGAMIAKSQKG